MIVDGQAFYVGHAAWVHITDAGVDAATAPTA